MKSDESSNVHYNDISSDAFSESSNDGKITIIGVSSDDDYGSDKVIDYDDDNDDNYDKGSCLNSSLESGLVDSIHSSGSMASSSRDSVEDQSNDI